MAVTTPAPMARAGTFVAGLATKVAAENLAVEIKAFAANAAGTPADKCELSDDSVVCGSKRLSFAELANAARAQGKTLCANGSSGGTPRSVAFNVQGFRVAVNKGTGEIKILKSVQAADAGRVANPMQCRGQVEGGVAQSLGATLYEEMVIDDGRPRRQSALPRLSPAVLCRCAAHRGAISPTPSTRSDRWARSR